MRILIHQTLLTIGNKSADFMILFENKVYWTNYRVGVGSMSMLVRNIIKQMDVRELI